MLLDHGADFTVANVFGETPLLIACEKSSVAEGIYLRLFLKYQANIFMLLPNGKTVIQMASGGILDAIVDYLTEPEANINQRDVNGNTALHFLCELSEVNCKQCACSQNQPPACHVCKLIKGGLDPDAMNDRGEAPLHIASERGHAGTVSALMRHGANALARTKEGLTPLHIASKRRLSGCVSLLAIGQSAVSVEDLTGKTALHHAVENGSVDIVKDLLDRRACALDPDYSGRTPLGLAIERGEVLIVKYCMYHLAYKWLYEKEKIENSFHRRPEDRYMTHVSQGTSSALIRSPDSLFRPPDSLFRRPSLFKNCIQDYEQLYKTSIKLIRNIDAITHGSDKFMPAIILESALFIPYFFERQEIDLERLYWLDGRTNPDGKLIWQAGASKGSIEKLAIKLFEARLPCGRELAGRIQILPSILEQFELQCAREVAKLKNTSLSKSKSIYDYLHEDDPASFRAILNPVCRDGLQPFVLDGFPMYRGLILNKIWKDSKRDELLSRARNQLLGILDSKAPLFNLIKDECICKKILSQLGNLDLLDLLILTESC